MDLVVVAIPPAAAHWRPSLRGPGACAPPPPLCPGRQLPRLAPPTQQHGLQQAQADVECALQCDDLRDDQQRVPYLHAREREACTPLAAERRGVVESKPMHPVPGTHRGGHKHASPRQRHDAFFVWPQLLRSQLASRCWTGGGTVQGLGSRFVLPESCARPPVLDLGSRLSLSRSNWGSKIKLKFQIIWPRRVEPIAAAAG